MTWFSLVSCAQLYRGRPRSDKKMSTNSWMLPGSNLWDFRFRTTAFRWPDCRNPFTKEFASWNRWPHFFVSGQNESSRAIQISSFRLTDFSFFFVFFFLAEQHMYMSLSEIQIQHEEDITRNPVSKGNEEIALTPTEILYQVRDTRAVRDAVSFQFTSPFLSISFEFQIETKFQRFFLNF